MGFVNKNHVCFECFMWKGLWCFQSWELWKGTVYRVHWVLKALCLSPLPRTAWMRCIWPPRRDMWMWWLSSSSMAPTWTQLPRCVCHPGECLTRAHRACMNSHQHKPTGACFVSSFPKSLGLSSSGGDEWMDLVEKQFSRSCCVPD